MVVPFFICLRSASVSANIDSHKQKLIGAVRVGLRVTMISSFEAT